MSLADNRNRALKSLARRSERETKERREKDERIAELEAALVKRPPWPSTLDDLFTLCENLQKELDNTSSALATAKQENMRWFEKGKDAIRRKNQSGCCCNLGDGGEEVIGACGLHQEWLDAKLATARRDAQ